MITQKRNLEYFSISKIKTNSTESERISTGNTDFKRSKLIKEYNDILHTDFKYDGRCGLYTIYKGRINETEYYVLTFERNGN